MNTNGIDLSGFYDLEPAVPVVIVVGGAGKSGADTRVDVGVVLQESFHCGVVEVGAVVDGCDFARGAAEDLGFPGVSDVLLGLIAER